MPLQSILIIDDDETDQYICKYVISKQDPSVDTISAFNGKEALEILREKEPDAIILDINMPIMNGFEFLEHYATEFEHHVPVVAMLTSSIHDQDREYASRFGFVKICFKKPFTEENFQQLQSLNTF